MEHPWWTATLRFVGFRPSEEAVEGEPYFVPEECKGLIPWPRQPPVAAIFAFGGAVLGGVVVSLALLLEAAPVPSGFFIGAGIVILVAPFPFLLLKLPPSPPLAFDRQGMLTPDRVVINWRDVAKLTYDIGVVGSLRPPHFAWLLTVSRTDGSEVEFRPPPLDHEDRETFMRILEDLSREHRFHFRFPRK